MADIEKDREYSASSMNIAISTIRFFYTVIDIPDDYYTQYEISEWLFPGTDPVKHLSIRSAQHIFKHAMEKVKIQKNISIHGLGHPSIRTTERYTHEAHQMFLNIQSPLDTMIKKN